MKRVFYLSVLALALLLFSSFGAAQAESPENSRSKAQGKATGDLVALYEEYQAHTQRSADEAFASSNPLAQIVGNSVVVDAVADNNAEGLKAELEALGMQNVAVAGRFVSGELPLAAIAELDGVENLAFAQASLSMNVATLNADQAADASANNAADQRRRPLPPGQAVSQGELALRTPFVREPFLRDPTLPDVFLTGDNTTVGVLSTTFNCEADPVNTPTIWAQFGGRPTAQDDRITGDLPKEMAVLQEGCTLWFDGGQFVNDDRGRAMMQVIADMAPLSSQLFHTAKGGVASMITGIERLQQTGADVIVDDVLYLREPMFQDGPIARTVDWVVGNFGVTYFSAAGNENGQSWQHAFSSANTPVIDRFPFGSPLGDAIDAHDFNQGEAGIDPVQRIHIAPGATVTFVLQWDDPFFSSFLGSPGADTDMDIFLLRASDPLIPYGPGVDIFNTVFSIDNNLERDPVEVLTFFNDPAFGEEQFDIVIERFAGPAPELMKLVWFTNDPADVGIKEYHNFSSTIYGHANSRGAETVGAAEYYRTPVYGVSLPELRADSGWGGTPIIYTADGQRMDRANWIVRAKPEIIGPSGVNTTFYGFDYPDAITPGETDASLLFYAQELNNPYPISTRYTNAGYLNDDAVSQLVYALPVEADRWPNFQGTSPAAAHMAGLAALMLQSRPDASPSRVYTALEATAIDMRVPGFDFYSGYGFVEGDDALAHFWTVNGMLANFSATTAANQVNVAWASGAESEATGFNLYRSSSADQEAIKLNDALISTEAGASHSITDSNVEAGMSYNYTLKAVDADGNEVTLDTVQATAPNTPTAVTLGNMSSGSAPIDLLPLMALGLLGLAGAGMAFRRFRTR